MEITTWLLWTLAVYRLATDIAWMDGPFEVYARLRGWAIVQFGANHWVAQGVSCPICLSFWLAVPLAWYGVEYWLAAAGVVAVITRRK